jgi:Helix-turn-helix domain
MSALALPFDLPRDSSLDELLADTRLGRLAKQLVVVLVRNWAWFAPRCWPSNASIAAKLGVHPKSIPRALRELELTGWADRLPTDNVPTGRYIRLLWRGDGGHYGATPGGATALPEHGEAELEEELRNVTRFGTTEPEEARQQATGRAQAAGPAVAPASPSEPVLGRPGASPTVPPIPAAIQALKHGAPPEVRADLVNRIAHRLRDKQPATYGFLRKWVNAAADGVGGALDALAHGFAKAEAALMGNHPCPGRILVRQVKDHAFRPPAASTIGSVEAHVAARPHSLSSSLAEPVGPPPSVALVDELEAQVRAGERGLRRLRRQLLVRLCEGGPEVPSEVQLAAVAALGRLGSAQQ